MPEGQATPKQGSTWPEPPWRGGDRSPRENTVRLRLLADSCQPSHRAFHAPSGTDEIALAVEGWRVARSHHQIGTVGSNAIMNDAPVQVHVEAEHSRECDRALDRQCCRFLSFTITVRSDGGPITLDPTGPATREFLAARFGTPRSTFSCSLSSPPLLEIAGCFAFWSWQLLAVPCGALPGRPRLGAVGGQSKRFADRLFRLPSCRTRCSRHLLPFFRACIEHPLGLTGATRRQAAKVWRRPGRGAFHPLM